MNHLPTGLPGLMARTFPQRVGVFADVQYLLNSASLPQHSRVDLGRLLREITGARHLVRAIAYVQGGPNGDIDDVCRAAKDSGYELRVRHFQPYPSHESGELMIASGSWEVGITTGVVSMAKKLDTIVLVAGSSAYVSLVECLRAHGCRVEVAGVEYFTSRELIAVANQYICIRKDWLFTEETSGHADVGPLDTQGALGSVASGQEVLAGLSGVEKCQGARRSGRNRSTVQPCNEAARSRPQTDL